MKCAPSCSLITALEGLKSSFSCLAHRDQYRVYIKSSTWHHIFVVLATILDPNKCCRSYVEAGSKLPKCPKLSIKAKNGRACKNNISTVTKILTLRFRWKISKGEISWPVKGFFILSILTKLLLAKKRPKLGIQLPNAGGRVPGLGENVFYVLILPS